MGASSPGNTLTAVIAVFFVMVFLGNWRPEVCLDSTVRQVAPRYSAAMPAWTGPAEWANLGYPLSESRGWTQGDRPS